MLRLTLSTEEYLMLGDDIKIVFLGGSNNHLRIMVDAPKEVDIVRSKVLEKAHPEIQGKTSKILCGAGSAGTLSQEKRRGKVTG